MSPEIVTFVALKFLLLCSFHLTKLATMGSCYEVCFKILLIIPCCAAYLCYRGMKKVIILFQTESTPSNDHVDPKIIHPTDTDPADRNKSVQKCSFDRTSDGRKERSEKSGKPGWSTNFSGRMSSETERKRNSDRKSETERRRKTGGKDETESSVRSNRSQSQNFQERHKFNEKKLSGYSPDTRRNFKSCGDPKYSDNSSTKDDQTSYKNRSLKQEDSHLKEEYRPLLTRHVNQILIRGDNVVMVALA